MANVTRSMDLLQKVKNGDTFYSVLLLKLLCAHKILTRQNKHRRNSKGVSMICPRICVKIIFDRVRNQWVMNEWT